MTQPWTRGDILDLHILILLVIWMLLDRNNVYFDQFVKKIWNKGWEIFGYCSRCGWDCDQP